jgi:hypothetical protein
MIFKNKSKGFIGAIGDDLPSLIPIFIGLIIFFSVFLSTYNVYKDKTNLYSLEQEAVTISLTLKEEPIISNYNIFQHQCNLVNTNKKWTAFVTDLDLNSDNQKSINTNHIEDSIVTFEDEDGDDKNIFICNNLYKEIILDSENNFFQTQNKKIVYLFPITLQENTFAKVKKLYIIVWE